MKTNTKLWSNLKTLGTPSSFLQLGNIIIKQKSWRSFRGRIVVRQFIKRLRESGHAEFNMASSLSGRVKDWEFPFEKIFITCLEGFSKVRQSASVKYRTLCWLLVIIVLALCYGFVDGFLTVIIIASMIPFGLLIQKELSHPETTIFEILLDPFGEDE